MVLHIVAYLHDILEDTTTSFDDLVELFGFIVAQHVKVLTKTDDVSYMDYIKYIKTNEICRIVKIADLLHNMDLSRLSTITKKRY